MPAPPNAVMPFFAAISFPGTAPKQVKITSVPVYTTRLHCFGAFASSSPAGCAQFWEDLQMSLSLMQSRALLGLEALRVTAEVHLAAYASKNSNPSHPLP